MGNGEKKKEENQERKKGGKCPKDEMTLRIAHGYKEKGEKKR